MIHACYQQLRSVTYKEFLGHGLELTPEQWIVLVQLWTKDGQSQSALSELTLRDPPTMSRILDTMQKGGLVTRVVDEQDARSRLVKLTRTGKALQAKLVPVAKRLVTRLEQASPSATWKRRTARSPKCSRTSADGGTAGQHVGSRSRRYLH